MASQFATAVLVMRSDDPDAPPGRPPATCRLIVNGEACQRPHAQRGLCASHAQVLRTVGRFAALARPPIAGRKLTLILKSDADLHPGICRIVADGVPCMRAAQRRGLCDRHYAGIWQRSDLRLDDFVAPAPDLNQPKIRLRAPIVRHQCRVSEQGQPCTRPSFRYGLCVQHATLKEQWPAIFDRVAAKERPAQQFHLRGNPKVGECRISEDGVGCTASAIRRGLCDRHHDLLRGTAAFKILALPPHARHTRFTRHPNAGPIQCGVLENDAACNRPPTKGGICTYHRRRITLSPHYELADFDRPEPAPILRIKSQLEMADGLCLAVVNETPCADKRRGAGLCRHHLRLAERMGVLEQFKQASAPMQRVRGMPHVYLDKNVIFDYLDIQCGWQGNESGAAVVEAIRAGTCRGTVSVDALKSGYSRIRYRLQRPLAEGGAGQSAEAADQAARTCIHNLFTTTAKWTIQGIDGVGFARILADRRGSLSLEDTLEWSCYQMARKRTDGPTMFLTRDADFVESVHPAEFLKEQRRMTA